MNKIFKAGLDFLFSMINFIIGSYCFYDSWVCDGENGTSAADPVSTGSVACSAASLLSL